MPAAMWSLMWQWKNHIPGSSHNMSAVCTLPASNPSLHVHTHVLSRIAWPECASTALPLQLPLSLSRRLVDCRSAVSLLVDAVAVHEERVAMEVGVVDVRFIAFCHHMPSHPDTAPFYSLPARLLVGGCYSICSRLRFDVTCLAGTRRASLADHAQQQGHV